MHETPIILLVALMVLLYGLFSKKFALHNISGPMIFLFAGIILSPLVLNVSNLTVNADIIKNIAEVVLIVVLFTDSAWTLF